MMSLVLFASLISTHPALIPFAAEELLSIAKQMQATQKEMQAQNEEMKRMQKQIDEMHRAIIKIDRFFNIPNKIPPK